MGKWRKSYRAIPALVKTMLSSFDEDNVKVLAGKLVSTDEVESGLYAHIGLTKQSLSVGNSWDVLPSVNAGTRSKRNLEGWVVVRKDLPKYVKYFYRDIPNFGDAARNGWSTVAIPKEVYERDQVPPYMFSISVNVQEIGADGKYGIVFSIDETFLKTSNSFEEDLLFALNLLQENTGVSGVVETSNPQFVFTSELDWSLFPPGNLEEVVKSLPKAGVGVDKDVVVERLQLLEQFQPTEYILGLGGNSFYVGAKFADDLVVFENMKYGNALYVLYENWKELSQKPRNELLKLKSSQFDRLVHTQGWENRFAVLMQSELQKRGLRIRIGRNMRRRR
jgi:hypothetical protein